MDIILLLLYVLFAVVTIQLIYFIFIFSRLAFHKVELIESQNIPVSVIICAKNEANNLKLNLPKILNQDYANFEVIVVNDNSQDHSLKVLYELELKFPILKIITLKSASGGNKKNALEKGIMAATYYNILLTDADCHPASTHWISTMNANLKNKKQIVLGYGAYEKIDSSWLNKLIRFETLTTAVQYFSYAKIGLAYMGVGRNLAYNKKIFGEANGLNSHKDLKSGDDDLFINAVSTTENVSICIDPKSFTISKPKGSLKNWIRQKRRHITTSTRYKPKYKFLLGLFYTSQFLFYTLGLLLLSIWLINGMSISYVIALLMSITMRFGVQSMIYAKCASKLKENDLIPYYPALEISLIVIQFYIFIRNIIKSPTYWN